MRRMPGLARNVAGIVVSKAASLTSVAARVPVVPMEVGVPDQAPVALLSVSPAGSPVAVKVKGVPPPATLIATPG